ncbi:MAG: type II CAAX endopeptidase family protein [Candidatus Latescibacterota bacterium]|nr:type II CAAX endopeptidase family protein [Candidatus Latescibacterota bacterium]
MEQRLTKTDGRLLISCLVLAAVSLAVSAHLFYDAFPEATIDFELTRDEARERAFSFLQHRGFNLGDYRHAAVFSFDDATKTFLERELGLKGASDVIGAPVRLWRWSHRWFRELQKEEFHVEVTTTGELVGFQQLVAEELEGAALDQQEARYQAEQFLGTVGHRLEELEFVEAISIERPHRTDHSFTWKLSGFEAEDATYRYKVGVQGNLIGEYREFLKVPEPWSREYEELRSHNLATGIVAELVLVVTSIAMLAMLVMSIRAQNVRWRTVLVFAAITFVLTFLATLNSLPVTVYGFDTTNTFGSFVAEQLLSAFAVSLLQALMIGFTVAGAEPVYRRWFPEHVSVSEQFLLKGIRTRRFLIGSVIGLTMAPVFIAYQTVFYTAAEDLGAWVPADIPYSEMVNTHIPWVVVLLIGFLPAVSEEFTSRAFSIPLLHRLLKHRWLAVVISAAVWGFAHASYPQQPFYIRGIEVGVVGIAVGYVMIRWGLLPVIVWHYTIDAFFTAMILLRSSNPYFVLSATISVGIALLPAIVAVALYVRHRFFLDPVSLLNREDSPPPVQPQSRTPDQAGPETNLLEPAEEGAIYHPLSPIRLGVCTAVVALSLGVFLFEHEEWFQPTDFATTPNAAKSAALTYLENRGVAMDSIEVAISLQDDWDPLALKYRLELGNVEAADAIYRDHLHSSLWQVRFFRPLQKEEWKVFVHPATGSVESVEHIVPEAAAGSDLSDAEARAVAEKRLRSANINPERLVLRESSSERLKNRRDHWFTFEAREGDPRNLAESLYRVVVHVAGHEPASLRKFIKLPEEWERERNENTLWRTLLSWVGPLAVIAMVLHLSWLQVGHIREGTIQWKASLWIGGLGGVAFMLACLNAVPTFYASYPTEIPPSMFTIIAVVIAVIGFLAVGLLVIGAVGLITALYPHAHLRLRPAGLGGQLRDALVLSSLAVAGTLASRRITEIIAMKFPKYAPAPDLSAPGGLDSLLPFLGGLLGAVAMAVAKPVVVGVLLYYALRVIVKPPLWVAAALVFGLAVTGSSSYSSGEFFFSLGNYLFSVGTTAAAIGWFLRDNIPAYILTAFLTASVTGGQRLFEQSAPLYQIHGYVWWSVAALVVLILAIHMLRSQPRKPLPLGRAP